MVLRKKYVLNCLPVSVYECLHDYFTKQHLNKRLFIDAHLKKYYFQQMDLTLPDQLISKLMAEQTSKKPLTFYVGEDFLPIIQKQAKFYFRSETDEMKRFCFYLYFYLKIVKDPKDKTLL